jgi:hypothetical protein
MGKRDNSGKFVKGVSGNPNGRPKNTRNASDPQTKLKRALDNGWDLVKLKEFIVDLVSDKETKVSPAQIERLTKTLADIELKLLEMDFKYNHSEEVEQQEEEDDEPHFSTTAG